MPAQVVIVSRFECLPDGLFVGRAPSARVSNTPILACVPAHCLYFGSVATLK